MALYKKLLIFTIKQNLGYLVSFFLGYGIWGSEIYKKIQNSKDVYTFITENKIESSGFVLIFLACLCFAMWLKNSKSTTEIKLENEIQEKNKKINNFEEEIENFKNKLEEAETAIMEIREEHLDNLFNLSSQFLFLLAVLMKFNHDDRISLYFHDSSNNHFILLARFSKNTNFSKKHRKTFPDNQGVLGFTWNGKHNFGEIVELPHTSKTFITKCQQLGIPEDVARNLSMKSTELISFPIVNNEKNIGVILIESRRKQGKKNNSNYMNDNKDNFCSIVQQHTPYLIELINYFLQYQKKLDNVKVDENE